VIKRAPLSTPDIVPEGARFIEATYSNPAGSRAYKLFIPTGLSRATASLVVMLHGCTQSLTISRRNKDELCRRRTNLLCGLSAQRSEANQAKCWNWFRTADQQRGRGEPSLIAGITRQIMRDYSVDPKRVYVGGLSAGAAAAAIMGATYKICTRQSACILASPGGPPLTFLCVCRHATRCGSDDRGILGDGPPVPTIVFHGDRDITVHAKQRRSNT